MGATPHVTSADEIPLALKNVLTDDEGQTYREFRRTLTPNYGRVWRDIGLGWGSLIGVVALLGVLSPAGWLGVAGAVAGTFAIGFALAYLNNFFHESAHYNLLADRKANDRATNLVLGWLFGSSIETYRQIHFQHHRALGTIMDSENSYFDALGVRYIVQALTGLKTLRTLRRYREMERANEGDSPGASRSRLVWSAGSGLAHVGIASGLWLVGWHVAGVSWLAGVLLTFPFFVSLRQVLEHRSEEADGRTDYRDVDHGPVNRLFGDGPFASAFGGAGFNRHALHHWEPQLSYTRLADLERWLERTEVRDLVRAKRTTYRDTFLRLLEL